MAGELNPDVITCDLLMPKMDGVTFVREQMSRRPLPILVLTATPEDGEQALQALEAGAVDVVQKPTALANEQLLEIRDRLVETVKALAGAHVRKLQPAAAPSIVESVARKARRVEVVVIGISTGGPQALRYSAGDG